VLAERVARQAGELLLARFGGPAQGLEHKGSRTDMVSDADRDAEALIEEALRGERPDDGLIAEEGAHSHTQNGRRWVVDPLDGTTNYLYGLPGWAVSIALEDEEGSAVGVVHQPVTAETYTATRGGGAQLNGEQIGVSAAEQLSSALIATGFAYDESFRSVQAELLTRVLPRVRDIRRAGAAALDLCFVAAGRVDAYYERGLQEWDWAAGSLVVTEAGGTLTRLEGEPAGLLAASPAIANELLTLVK